MDTMKFKDNTEMEIIGALKDATDGLEIKIAVEPGRTMDTIVETFTDPEKTAVMRRYDGPQVLEGYSGYTIMQSATYQPDVTMSIDYEQTDPTTASGFVEEKVNLCTVMMRKVPAISVVARQTDQNIANIDYIAMETGVDL